MLPLMKTRSAGDFCEFSAVGARPSSNKLSRANRIFMAPPYQRIAELESGGVISHRGFSSHKTTAAKCLTSISLFDTYSATFNVAGLTRESQVQGGTTNAAHQFRLASSLVGTNGRSSGADIYRV